MMDESLRQAILEVWRSLPEEMRHAPATPARLEAFESCFGPIPDDFRWFLAECGGGAVGSEWVDGIERLAGTHRKFRQELGPGGWTSHEVFVIGWDGAGNPFGIHRAQGSVLVEDHTFGGVHKLAESFAEFLARGLNIRI
jgi:hypothetical protein